MSTWFVCRAGPSEALTGALVRQYTFRAHLLAVRGENMAILAFAKGPNPSVRFVPLSAVHRLD